MIRDILLQLASYPSPTPDWVFDPVVRLAERFDARISVALCQVHIPRVSNFLADRLVGANEVIARENDLSREHALRLAEAFVAQVPETVRGEQMLVDCISRAAAAQVAARGRLFDLLVLPVHGDPEQESLAEGLVFGSGRPVLLLPESARAQPWDRVILGWDGGRAAARALADAIPLCRAAREVRIVAVGGEKPLGHGPGLDSVREHLARHEIAAECVEIAADGKNAGAALLDHAAQVGADLLVAGAFGHSRMREFILGGATRSLIAAPTLPVLLSH
ncbi:universal stress protein [Sphingosinithalassobacter sp. CS137]|uniref:universal stress protein n=1 Tax=Sphingosinithalassobacter sp. CS137 TaxID=2762748 RepID=UPI00165DEFCE|nr:universal stress protein [Sphingosinithalassobacter sp. CS137]